MTLPKTEICTLSNIVKGLAVHLKEMSEVHELAATLHISPNPLKSEIGDDPKRIVPATSSDHFCLRDMMIMVLSRDIHFSRTQEQ